MTYAKSIIIRIPLDLYDFIVSRSRESKMSKSEVVREALRTAFTESKEKKDERENAG